ncbi:MAG: hypothetical protein U0527_01475 [Candidatus Eisenbacteria bacterium]
MHARLSHRGLLPIAVCALLVFGCSEDDHKPTEPGPTPTVVRGSGANATELSTYVAQYRALLGSDNGGDPGTRGDGGYRELTWDAVPDEESAPNAYHGDFFNAASAPRAKGIVLSTPGTRLEVSAALTNSTSTPPRFGDINEQYPSIFKTFSGEKLFSPVGSNVVDVYFFVPGTNVPAAVRGFGAVYTDVDTRHTAFEYFDQNGNSLGSYETPISNESLSFLGVAFDRAVVFRVQVRYGTAALGPNDDDAHDVAVMDNFIFGEPQRAE